MGFPSCLILQLLMFSTWIQRTGSSHKIKHKNNETAVLGENVTIFCNLTTPEDVVQITWQKIQDSLLQNIGTYSSKYGEKILPPYVDRLRCEIIEPDSSFITIHQVTFEDEACYKCLFNVFPYGSHGGLICLSIITVSELRTELRFDSVSKGFLSLINSAMGKPAPQISLFPSHVLIHPPEEYLAQHPNGTVTVTKIHTISLDAVRSLGLKHLIVYMDHPLRNEEKIVPLPVNQNYTAYFSSVHVPAVAPLSALVCILSIIVIVLCFVQRKKKSKNACDSAAQKRRTDFNEPLTSHT